MLQLVGESLATICYQIGRKKIFERVTDLIEGRSELDADLWMRSPGAARGPYHELSNRLKLLVVGRS